MRLTSAVSCRPALATIRCMVPRLTLPVALALCWIATVPAPADAARGMRVAVQDDSTLIFRAGEYVPLDTPTAGCGR